MPELENAVKGVNKSEKLHQHRGLPTSARSISGSIFGRINIMAVFGIGLCLPVLFACVVSMSVVQGRNLRRRHNHHSHLDYYLDFEDSIPRDLSRRFEDNPEYQQDSYREQMERRESSRILDGPAENEERIPLPHRKHVYDLRNYAESLRKDEPRRQANVEDALTRFVVRRKRHNRHGSGSLNYQRFNKQDKWELDVNKQHQQLELYTSTTNGLRASFELEVKEAQNSSICNYTVESIPIPGNRTTRMPRDLEHIRCNYIGSSCQTGDYCCIQTYRHVEVLYDDGEDREKMKIYVGCVCALQDLNSGLTEYSQLPIND